MNRNPTDQSRRSAHERPAGSRRLGDEAGVAIVEFALILPLIMLIVVSILDFGRALNYWADTTHLASEGARYAAVDRIPSGSTSLQSWVRDQADSGELKNGGSISIEDPLQVCVTPLGDEVGDPVEVTVSTEYKWIPLLGVDDVSTTITGKATMRRERLADNVDDGCE